MRACMSQADPSIPLPLLPRIPLRGLRLCFHVLIPSISFHTLLVRDRGRLRIPLSHNRRGLETLPSVRKQAVYITAHLGELVATQLAYRIGYVSGLLAMCLNRMGRLEEIDARR